MENASKALLIAAAVLVAIIIITIGIKVYTSSSGTGKVATDTGKTISDKTGDATDLATYEITGKRANNIKYFNGETENQKNKEDVKKDDTIKIGTETFMVFLVDEEGIKAMPYYNLMLDSNPIKQATAETAESAGECQFSTSEYWKYDENSQLIPNWNSNVYYDGASSILDINMKDSRNIVQTYVNRYKTTLEGMGGSGIEVRLVTKKELPFTNNIEISRNPSCKGIFWTSSLLTTRNCIYCVQNTNVNPSMDKGGGNWDNIYNTSRGVRPIIIIPK